MIISYTCRQINGNGSRLEVPAFDPDHLTQYGLLLPISKLKKVTLPPSPYYARQT